MHAAPRIDLPIPSPKLLRFLKSQAEGFCFFSSNVSPKTASSSPSNFRSFLRRNAPNSLPSSARSFTSSQPCRATLESSILNFDFLKHPPPYGHSTSRASPNVTVPRTTQIVSHPRHASTEEQPFLQKLWERRRTANKSFKDGELPPPPSFLDDASGASLGRSKAGKAANELKLRCTEINESGDVTLVNGEFKKSELIAKVRTEHSSRRSWLVTEWLHSMGFFRATFARLIRPSYPIS